MKWQTFKRRIPKIHGEGLLLVEIAFLMAEKLHTDELRDDGRPYFDHPVQATLRAYKLGERDPGVLAAILTHDMEESGVGLNKPVNHIHFVQRVYKHSRRRDWAYALSFRTKLLTKDGHSEEDRIKSWQKVRRGRGAMLAKCYERLDNVLSFGSMKGKKGETRTARIKRKVDETIREIPPIITWLMNDTKVRQFPSERARKQESAKLLRLRNQFIGALARHGGVYPR